MMSKAHPEAHPSRCVLHILPSAASGGGPAVVCNFIRASNWKNVVVVPCDHAANFAEIGGEASAIHDVEVRTIRLSTLGRLKAIARDEGVVLIHSHGRAAGLYGRLAAKRLGLASVHTFHGWHPSGTAHPAMNRAAEHFLARLTTRLVAVSASEREVILRDGLAPPGKVEVLQNAVRLPPTPAEPFPSLELGVRHVVTLSRQSPQKDLPTLIRTAEALGSGYRLHVIGGVLQQDETYARAARQAAADRRVANITFHGDVAGAAAWLDQFEVYLSTARWEGLPTAIIEAFLARVPVVATNCAGNVDLVQDGKTGLLRPMGDARALADAVQLLTADGRLRNRVTTTALAFAETSFEPRLVAARQHALYEECLREVANER